MMFLQTSDLPAASQDGILSKLKNDDLKAAATRGKTALIADDNAFIRSVLADAFLSGGFKACAQAQNGEEAIEIADEIEPDVIVLDLSMPVMNGLQAASELRKNFPETPIILFTLYGDSISKADASKAGVTLVLLKTVPLPTLIDTARALLSN